LAHNTLNKFGTKRHQNHPSLSKHIFTVLSVAVKRFDKLTAKIKWCSFCPTVYNCLWSLKSIPLHRSVTLGVQ